MDREKTSGEIIFDWVGSKIKWMEPEEPRQELAWHIWGTARKLVSITFVDSAQKK